MNLLKKFLPFIIILFLSFWTIKPLFNSGFFPMHDDTQVGRVFEMHKSLADGMFPVRWVSDLGYGYGYPIFNFYAPLAYYIGSFFMFFGFNALTATKLMIGLGTILAGVFMYLFSKEFWGENGAIVAATLYLFTPYHAVNIYVRGAIAELWAYAFMPLVFFAIYKVYRHCEEIAAKRSHKDRFASIATTKRLWIWVCISASSYALIIISHNLTAMMVTPFVFVFSFILYLKLRMVEKIYKPHFVLLGLLVGMLLSAFYWLPVLFEMKFTDVLSVVGGGSKYMDHFVCLPQLWNSPWGFGGSVPGCVDGLSLKIGKIHILLSLFSLPTLFFLYSKSKVKFSIIIFSIISLIFSIFLTLVQSRFIWDAIPHMAFFQFPWRFLALISFFISFLGGSILMCLPSTNLVWVWSKRVVGVIIVFAIIFVNSELFAPQRIINTKVADYTSKYALNWTISKISDEYMPKDFFKPLSPTLLPKQRIEKSKDISLISINEKTQEIQIIGFAQKKAELVANVAYFPGWHVYVDGKQVWFSYFNKGIIIKIPQGKHTVNIRYTQTTLELIGSLASIASVIVLFAGIIVNNRGKYNG